MLSQKKGAETNAEPKHHAGSYEVLHNNFPDGTKLKINTLGVTRGSSYLLNCEWQQENRSEQAPLPPQKVMRSASLGGTITAARQLNFDNKSKTGASDKQTNAGPKPSTR